MPHFVERVADHLKQDGERIYRFTEYGLPPHLDDDMCSKAFPIFLVILIRLGKTTQHFEFPRDLNEIWDEYSCYDLPICSDCKEGLGNAVDKGRSDAWEGLSAELEGELA